MGYNYNMVENMIERDKYSLIELIYYLLVMLSVGLFLILPIRLDTLRNVLTIGAIFLLVIFFPMLIVNIKRFSKSAFIYAIFVLISVLYELYRASNIYNYSLLNIFFASRQYVWILLFLVILYLFNNTDNNMYKILRNTLNILLCSLGLRTISWGLYTFFKIEMFSSILREYGDLWYRNEHSIRVDGTPLIIIGILIATFLYIKKRETRYLYSLLAILAYIFFVNQTRVLAFSIVISITLMFLYSKGSTFKFSKILLLGLALSFFALGGINYLTNLIDSSLMLQDRGLGYRYWELDYYINLLKNGNWVNGVGILTSTNLNSSFVLYGNWITKMYLDDLGFLELFVQFGLLSIPMYLYPLLKLVFLIKKLSIKRCDVEKGLLIGILSSLVLTSISMNVFGIQRSFSLAIILAIIFYYDYKLKHNIEDQVCDG